MYKYRIRIYGNMFIAFKNIEDAIEYGKCNFPYGFEIVDMNNEIVYEMEEL